MTEPAVAEAGIPVWTSEKSDREAVLGILEKHHGERGGLIAVLGEIQAKYSYLPEDALRIVSEEMGRPLVDIYGAATFYHSFSLKPRGKHLVSACLGTACHVRGAPRVVEELKQQLGIEAGETTQDKEFTLETVNCLGACALGPIVVADGQYFSNVRTTQVTEILDKTREGPDKVDINSDERFFPLEVGCPRCNHSLMDEKHLVDGLPSIRFTISFNGQHCALNRSSLYGSHNSVCETEIPPGTVVDFFCPNCHAELVSASSCAECGTPMTPVAVRGGGILQVCKRWRCKGRRLDLNGVNV